MELKWFKMNADFCDDSRVLFVETQKNGGMILYHFLKLQCMAAKCNRDGGVYVSEKIPHTAKTLANQWHLHKSTTENIIKTLEEAELIEIINGVIFIADWDKIQSSDKLEEIRKSNRERQKRHREKCKNVTLPSRYCNDAEEDIEKEEEKELEGEGDDI